MTVVACRVTLALLAGCCGWSSLVRWLVRRGEGR
jgi:hypothetical protein